MVTFLHGADLHLDSPLRGLERYEGAPVDLLRGATRRAFEGLIELALEAEVDFVLLAGDLFDGDWRDYSTGLFFARHMSRLREAGIDVYVVLGNHDAQSKMTRGLRLPDNVHRFDSMQPGTCIDEELGVAIHGQSFHRPHEDSDLSLGYPAPVPGLFNIGMLHTAAEGRDGHYPYAPTTVETLAGKGYEYWALGHVHCREILRMDPWIVFPGNIQGRYARETGAKGCTLVTVDSGRVSAVEHRAIDVVRWARCVVNADDASTGPDVLDRVGRAVVEEMTKRGDGRPMAMRVVVRGHCRAHTEIARAGERWQRDIQAVAMDVGGGEVWIERVELEITSGPSREELLCSDDAVAGLVRSIDALSADAAALIALGGELFGELQARLRAELRSSEDAPDLYDPAFLRPALLHAREILIDRLVREGGH